MCVTIPMGSENGCDARFNSCCLWSKTPGEKVTVFDPKYKLNFSSFYYLYYFYYRICVQILSAFF